MKQPEALRLADELDIVVGGTLCGGAAAELRRLHEANQELLEALKSLVANLYEGNFISETRIDAALAAIAKAGGAS